MTRHDVEEWIGASFGIVVVLPVLGSIGFGVLTILFQCLKWLKSDVWETLTLRDGFTWWFGPMAQGYIPQTGFLGLDRILLWLLDNSPLAVWLILVGPMIWFSAANLSYTWLLKLVERPRFATGSLLMSSWLREQMILNTCVTWLMLRPIKFEAARLSTGTKSDLR